ncbi:BMP family ABC transporter substrate-binding protein [[Mycoplasma] testudinis]|uniref:BMP family ABC transporter substrate-binding protein n=1 Tax=[Mycoplasma] testudinis TaxID=33924 RepID=UPI0006988609|nr:BMP family ABC transporter substrate-binding protein [[Mycoplasma] testudinis]
MRNKKKIAKILTISGSAAAAVAVIAGGIAGSFGNFGYTSTVQLIVSDNSSTLADQSFSESSWDGIRNFYIDDVKLNSNSVPQANDNSVIDGNGIWKRPGTDDQSRVNTYNNAQNDGSKIAVATGFNQQNALNLVVDPRTDNQQVFSDFGFIFVDGAMSTSAADGTPYNVRNISSITYRADQGSFLVGVATAAYLNLNHDYFQTVGEINPQAPAANRDTYGVSSFVGLAFPSTLNYFMGFRQGIAYWNEVMQPHLMIDQNTPTKKISWISPDNSFTMASFLSGSFAANEQRVNTLTPAMLNNGASVIFPIAGPQTAQVVANVQQQVNRRAVVLGVDTAQENITDLQFPLNGNIPSDFKGLKQLIPFSSLKDLTLSVKDTLEAIRTGKTVNGFNGFGFNNVGNIDNRAVGISPAGDQFLVDPLFFVSSGTTISDGQTLDSTVNSIPKQLLSNVILGDNSQAPDYQTKKNEILANYGRILTENNTRVKVKSPNDDVGDWMITGDNLIKSYGADLPAIQSSAPAPNENNKYPLIAVGGGPDFQSDLKPENRLDGTGFFYNIGKS